MCLVVVWRIYCNPSQPVNKHRLWWAEMISYKNINFHFYEYCLFRKGFMETCAICLPRDSRKSCAQVINTGSAVYNCSTRITQILAQHAATTELLFREKTHNKNILQTNFSPEPMQTQLGWINGKNVTLLIPLVESTAKTLHCLSQMSVCQQFFIMIRQLKN